MLDPRSREQLAAGGSRRTVAAGATLIAEGDACDSLHLLVEGWAYRYATTRSGARQILAILLPGDLCNIDVLAFDRLDYGIRMANAAEVVSVARSRVAMLCRSNPDLAAQLHEVSCSENAMLSRWALGLGRKSAQQALAHLLCELAVRLDAVKEDGSARFPLPLTQEQLSDVLGLTPVHMNRTLQHFRAAELLSTSGRAIHIPSFAALRDLGEFHAGYLHRERDVDSADAVEVALPPPRNRHWPQ